MRLITTLTGLSLVILPFAGNSQCTTTNATSCACETPGSINCDLLPDMIPARPPLLAQGSNGVIEYSQSGNGSNDGRLRISVSTPNIGHGPLEIRTTNRYVCGTDTIVGTAPTTCPNTGLPPKQLITQRVYHKNGNTMTSYDRDAGSMTYHPTHGHMHVDDWGVFTLRTSNGDPDPLNWPVVGSGAKLAFCLMDYGSCSTYNGHCVDSAGNVLLNGNFPNYGLGGGSYNCSPSVQGISSGYTDIYYQHLDGMWIDIPPGTCNGQYYIVVRLDPYNYFLEENEDNNVIAVPYTLTQQASTTTATISSDRSGPICSSDQVTLTASGGPGFTYLWSTGATTQQITTNVSGNYVVTVTSTCGVITSSPYNVSVLAAPPATTGNERCGPGSLNLAATSPGSIINWFNNSTGGNSLGTGNNFVTPVLQSTATYFAEATNTTPPYSGYCNPANNTFGSGSYFTGSQYQIFDVFQTLTLVSVKVYAQAAGNRTIELRNSSGSLINTITANVPAGESRITLNWVIGAGTDYRLTRSGSTDLYRNSSGVAYPYTIPGYISIKNSSAGTAYYYFFYDWEISTTGQTCVSSRTLALATVNPLPVASITANGATSFCRFETVTLNANTGSGLTYKWKKYGNYIAGATSSSLIVDKSGKYKAEITDGNGCSRSSNSITVTVYPLPQATITASGPLTFCQGDSVVFTANSGAGLTYQWKKYSTIIPGASTSSYTAKTTGKYRVIVTNSNGCSKSSAVQDVDVNCRIAGELANSTDEIDVYPNPASGEFEVTFSADENSDCKLNLTDMSGRVIYSETYFVEKGPNMLVVNPGNITNGVYMLNMIRQDKQSHTRIIIQH